MQKEYNGSVLDIKLYRCGREEREFDVYLQEGWWPQSMDLITLCDGGDPDFPIEEQLHGGGEIKPGEHTNHRRVIVYKK